MSATHRSLEFKVFLDANVLFSAAWRADSGLRMFWRRSDLRLITSVLAIDEARRNLDTDEQRRRLDDLIATVHQVGTPNRDSLPPDAGAILDGLHEKDRPLLAAAIAARCTHFITGDKAHFGHLYGCRVAGVAILRPADMFKALTD